MFRVAICDDEQSDLLALNEMLQRWKEKESIENLQTDTFSDPEDLIKRHTQDKYDLLVLDIVMPKLSGIDLVRSLRKNGDETMVIYVSGATKYAMDAFEVQALGYIHKPLKQEKLYALLKRAKVLHEAQPQKDVNIIGKNGPARIKISDIVCVENKKRTAIYTLYDNSSVEVKRREGTFEEVLQPFISEKAFVQTHKSFLVNMKNIKAFKEQRVVLDNGMEIPISRRKKMKLMEQYKNYRFGKM